ncbi:MAG: methylmalonyl-CoA mutase [Gammaproteobacteria bacterium]|nr:MAG: methylmalonyl-CoA mutase [Gammaproteobacteria bacterium]
MAIESNSEDQQSNHPLRIVTAASLFDGHDAAINIMRRLIQAQGVEVIHLGHNRSVDEVVRAAIQEDADAIALSSYQGGHMEYFRYVIDKLASFGAAHIQVFGGGGGTITFEEAQELQAYGVTRIYHPEDGMKMGLVEMIKDLVDRCRVAAAEPSLSEHSERQLAQQITAIEEQPLDGESLKAQRAQWKTNKKAPVIGLTGTGGAGKSSVTDEFLVRFLSQYPDKKIAVLAVDPTRRKTGGALLGDRIRINALRSDRTFMRSVATRRQHLATAEMLGDMIACLSASDYDLVLVETAGIGQSDSEIVDLVDFSVYVMTSEFGAPSQLEKIDMLDFADVILLNKFDKPGSLDAIRDIRKQWQRNHNAFEVSGDDIPVMGTIASKFNDQGMNNAFSRIMEALTQKIQLKEDSWKPQNNDLTLIQDSVPDTEVLIPQKRARYLADIADSGREEHSWIDSQAAQARKAQHYYEILGEMDAEHRPPMLEPYTTEQLSFDDVSVATLRQRYNAVISELHRECIAELKAWPERYQAVRDAEYSYQVRGRDITGSNYKKSLSGLDIPKVAPPHYQSWGEQLDFLFKENLPGAYPFTAGGFPYRRVGEDPTRMFAGEGTPEQTNRRFHYLAGSNAAARLSTAFDSVTLYGEDPAVRPDIFGKIGNSGVSIATLDDMKKLYSGFDLCAVSTSVSMTINGPAPMMLGFFMNAAIDQQIEKYLKNEGKWPEVEAKLTTLFGDNPPVYRGDLPEGHDGFGLGLLGVTGDNFVDADTYNRIAAETMKQVRGTVQADILKEDQAQNTCIFSTQFALKMMADVQESFIKHQVRNYYSVSVSGYHIAEAGANPITQLAFTLANGFTLVEYYLARGMDIDDFAPNMSFFFSNGMDPEYAVIGRVARRIWARAMKKRYNASKRSQLLKYHIQTSGRSLHAQEIQFNDIRTTLQALYAIFDNCNSLHTNAYDEAITTPTEESVRRAVAIQMIINRELGLNICENPFQGSFIIETLTDMVEQAVYDEFDRIAARGGVLGAMDTMYQRSKIQEESMEYEHRKHDGSLPIIGVNTFLNESGEPENQVLELVRSTDESKNDQINSVAAYQKLHSKKAEQALAKLMAVACSGNNIFEELLTTTRYCSLGQISHALYQVGGEYRRNM